MTFRKVASLDDLWSGEMMDLDVGGNSILLVNVDDHIYAYADICPHQKNSSATPERLHREEVRTRRAAAGLVQTVPARVASHLYFVGKLSRSARDYVHKVHRDSKR